MKKSKTDTTETFGTIRKTSAKEMMEASIDDQIKPIEIERKEEGVPDSGMYKC